MAVFMEKSK